ncbi:chromatin-binding transcription regulator ADA2 [Sugiyamaella lignohabitans]|uniref:Transcriptional adapter 2 n=1 Tax=Sugiyamaella lignohabitans TaxID=796027 RepID=A0A167E8F6_9ASCO|nr:chromatin-binding transcription regulator ADA2 [Sugiyamaella lignohabitans]ANB13769.1 chromatin-binding transcription regulator ADA2 [Sugiyamaella lignohabitans]
MIVEQHAYPIFDDDWGADEELLLLEGAELQGLGNWQDISDHIGGRSREEVDEHYNKVYLQSATYPLPEMNKKFNISPAEFAEKKRQRLEDRRKNAPALPIPKQKPTASVPACHEVQGYMPGRLEFEQETENEAEMSVKDMVFDPEEPSQEVNFKLTILDIYNSRLTTRAERKRSILAHGLLDYRKNAGIEKKRTKEERDLVNKLKPFARMMTRKDYEMLTDSMLTELRCRRRIAELQEYRRNGIRTLEAAAKYERDKVTRINALNRAGIILGGGMTPSSNSTILNNSNIINGTSLTRNSLGSKPGTPGPLNSTSSIDSTSTVNDSTSSTNGSSNVNNTAVSVMSPLGYKFSPSVFTNISESERSSPFGSLSLPGTSSSTALNGGSGSGLGSTGGSVTPTATTNGTTLKIRKSISMTTPPLDISQAADVELLSPQEQLLCSQLRILPKPYLAIKETLFRELVRTGGILKRKTARELIKIDAAKTGRIYEFFQSQNWLS